jgi:hypothetical protein
MVAGEIGSWVLFGVVTAAALAVIGRHYAQLRGARAEFGRLLAEVRADPLNRDRHVRFLRRFSEDSLAPRLPFDEAYRVALDVLAANPKSLDVKVFARAVGVLHFGRQHADGKPTSEEDETINTDIAKLTR